MIDTNEVIIKTEIGTFALVRDMERFERYWITRDGRCPGALKNDNIGMVVPAIFSTELYAMALEEGYSVDSLSTPKRPIKEHTSNPREAKAPSGKLKIKISMKPRIVTRGEAIIN